METVSERKDKVQKYKNGGGKITSTVTAGEVTVKQEIRTKNPEQFNQLKKNLSNSIPDNTKYIE